MAAPHQQRLSLLWGDGVSNGPKVTSPNGVFVIKLPARGFVVLRELPVG